MIRNGNDSEELLNKVAGCDQLCDDAYDKTAGVTETTEQALSKFKTCHNQCSAENGLPPTWK